MAHRLREMVSETVRDVVRSDDIDVALDRLAGGFQDEYDLWRVSISEIDVSERVFRLLAVWSVDEPTIDPGIEIPFSTSAAMETLAADLISGRPVFADPTETDFGLVSDVYRREGLRSWLCIPLRHNDSFWGALNLASPRQDAFEPSDISLFSALIVGIERHLLSLVSRGAGPRG